jgi:hypothetical protein
VTGIFIVKPPPSVRFKPLTTIFEVYRIKPGRVQHKLNRIAPGAVLYCGRHSGHLD